MIYPQGKTTVSTRMPEAAWRNIEDLTYQEHLRFACEPTTPAGYLESILASYMRKPAIRRTTSAEGERLLTALVSNPNLPPRSLARLAGYYPEEFCTNPIAPLLALEHPDFIHWMTEDEAMSLLASASLPASLAAAFAGAAVEPHIRREAALHISFAGEVAADEDWRSGVRRVLKEETDALRLRSAVTSSEKRAWKTLLSLVKTGVAPTWLLKRQPRYKDLPVKELGRQRSRALVDGFWTFSSLLSCWVLAYVNTPYLPARRGDTVELCWEEGVGYLSKWLDHFGVAQNAYVATHLPHITRALAEKHSNRFVRAAARERLSCPQGMFLL